MKVELVSYLVEFLPILVGLIFLLVFRYFSFYRPKITIHTRCDFDGLKLDLQETKDGKCNFDELIRDRMIIDGINPYKTDNLEANAAASLGIVHIRALDAMSQNRVNQNRLVLFSDNKYTFLDKILAFNRSCGLLLSYVSSNRFEMVNCVGDI